MPGGRTFILRQLRTMHLPLFLVSGLIGALWAAPVMQQNPIFPQEDFDLKQFMGRWYEVALVSTCPHKMQRKRGNPAIVRLDLKHVTSERNFTMAASTIKNGSCTETSTHYTLTNTSGKFFHHIPRFGADIDTFVVHTTDVHAIILQLSIERPLGIITTTGRLYTRSMTVSPAALEEFKAVVRQQGMSEDDVIINQNKGECVPDNLGKKSKAHSDVTAETPTAQM